MLDDFGNVIKGPVMFPRRLLVITREWRHASWVFFSAVFPQWRHHQWLKPGFLQDRCPHCPWWETKLALLITDSFSSWRSFYSLSILLSSCPSAEEMLPFQLKKWKKKKKYLCAIKPYIAKKKRCSSCLGRESQWKLSLNLCVLALCWEFNVIFSLAAVRELVIVFRIFFPPLPLKSETYKENRCWCWISNEKERWKWHFNTVWNHRQQQQQQQCSAGDGIKRQVRHATSAVWRSTLGRLMRSERKSGTCKECTESVDTLVVVRDGRGASCSLVWIFNPLLSRILKHLLLSDDSFYKSKQATGLKLSWKWANSGDAEVEKN